MLPIEIKMLRWVSYKASQEFLVLPSANIVCWVRSSDTKRCRCCGFQWPYIRHLVRCRFLLSISEKVQMMF